MVQRAAGRERGGRVDAAVRSEGVDRDTAACLEHNQIAQWIKDDTARLRQLAQDLGCLPTAGDAIRESGGASIGTSLRKG